MSISLIQLKAFHFVASEGSFTKASARMNVTQPTVSAQVRLLEETYGVRLFERKGRVIELTNLGKDLYNVTRRLYGLQDDAEELLEGAKDLKYGHLVIGGDSPQAALEATSSFRERHENITLSLKMGSAQETLNDLYGFKTDVAILGNIKGDPRLVAQPLYQMKLVCFVHRSHPLAKRKSLSFEELENQPMVLRNKGSLTRSLFDAEMERLSIQPKVVLEITTREAVSEAVANNIGIGVVLDKEAPKDARLQTIPFTDTMMDVTEYAICLKERSRLRVVKAFMDVAKEIAEAY